MPSGGAPSADLGREPLASLRATALEDRAPGTRRHPGTEPVLALPAPDVWPVSPLHGDPKRVETDHVAGRPEEYRRIPPKLGCPQPQRSRKSWKERGGRCVGTGFPHLWRAVWREPKCLQMPHLSRIGHGRDGRLIAPPGRCYCRAPASNREDGRDRVEHPIEPSADDLWDDVSARLRGALNDKTYRNWFNDVGPVAVDSEVFVLGVPNDFAREWIERNFVELIRAAMNDVTGTSRRLELRVREAPAMHGAPAAPVRPPLVDGAAGAIQRKYTF